MKRLSLLLGSTLVLLVFSMMSAPVSADQTIKVLPDGRVSATYPAPGQGHASMAQGMRHADLTTTDGGKFMKVADKKAEKAAAKEKPKVAKAGKKPTAVDGKDAKAKDDKKAKGAKAGKKKKAAAKPMAAGEAKKDKAKKKT